MVQNSKGEYFLFTPGHAYKISANEGGYYEMQEVENSQSTNDFELSYPKYSTQNNYNLPFLFLTNYSSQDKLGLVFDVNKGKYLDVDYSSCVGKAPNSFYNKTIDPFVSGPYKNLNYKVISPNHVLVNQSSQNAGCITQEGSIDLYFSGDQVKCDITIANETSC
jgi:hypothetical protein